jgi:plasmid stabilization system protein ParE
MRINRSPRYLQNLFKILDHIAQDKLSASGNFKNDLDELIENIPNFPYKFRKSVYFDDENIRDMIYKGYTIIYKINTDKNIIDIIRIFNKNKPPLSLRYNKS